MEINCYNGNVSESMQGVLSSKYLCSWLNRSLQSHSMVINAKQKMFNFNKCFEVCSLQSSWLQGFRNLNLWNLCLKFVPIYLQYILLYLSHLRPNFHSDAERKMFKFNFQANLIALLIKLNCNKPFLFQTFLWVFALITVG